MRVTQSKNETMTNNRADKIIKSISSVLRNAEFGGYSCKDLSFIREGSVTKNPSVKEYINTKSELNALLNSTNSSVFIVRSINYCGGPVPAGVVGCAAKGSSIVVEDFTANTKRASIAWLHEYGHSQGLSRATDSKPHTTRANAVMNARISTNTTGVTSKECQYFKKASSRFPVKTGLTAEIKSLDEEDAVIADDESKIEKLLHEGWIELPIEELKELSETEVNEIRQILFNIEKSELWANAITALATVGKRGDIDLLKSIISLNSKAESRAIQRAILQIPFSIAVISKRHNSETGVNFLIRNSNPNNSNRLFELQLDQLLSFSQQFSVQSTRALALMGQDSQKAKDAISNVKNANEVGQFDLGVSSDFFEQLEEITKDIDRLGVEKYLSREAQ